MGVRNRGKLERDLLEELNGVAKAMDKGALEAIGDGVIREMKDMIGRGISPIEGIGRFPEYKVKTKQRHAAAGIRAQRDDRRRTKKQAADAKKLTKKARTAAKITRGLGKLTGSSRLKQAAKDYARRGKQLALKARLLRSRARREQGGIRAATAAKKDIKGYPYTVQKKFPQKKPRPVNLFLSGRFLSLLKKFVTGGQGAAAPLLEIGFDDDKAQAMEEGHRIGWLGQGRRPIIPQGNEKFAQRIQRAVEKILGQYIAKRLRDRGR